MKRAVGLLIAILMFQTANAIEDTPANRTKEADRYIEAMPPQELLQDLTDHMALNLPPEKREAFRQLMMKHLDVGAVTKVLRDTLVKHFTADELSALADFYGSPVGKSAMKKFGASMAEGMRAIQAEVQQAQA